MTDMKDDVGNVSPDALAACHILKVDTPERRARRQGDITLIHSDPQAAARDQ